MTQVFTLNSEDILSKKEEYINVLNDLEISKKYSIVMLCLTDIIKNGSYILYNKKCEEKIKEAMELEDIYQGLYIPEIVSRKKQIIPKLMRYIKQ